jgi:hypothetical protein
VNSNSYFDKVTQVADEASPGCAEAVRSTMFAVRDDLLTNYTRVKDAAADTGFCIETFPAYIRTVEDFVSENLIYLVSLNSVQLSRILSTTLFFCSNVVTHHTRSITLVPLISSTGTSDLC